MTKKEREEEEAQWAAIRERMAAEENLTEAGHRLARAQFAEVELVAKKLINFKLDNIPEHFRENYGYAIGDENAPFFSETFLYVLLGKEDARTVLAYLGQLLRALGYKQGVYDLYEE